MSVIKDIQLNGSNLCNVECMDKNATLHPETNVNQVLVSQNTTVTLNDWLSYNKDNPSQPLDGFDSYNGLIPWLENYYPINTDFSNLPIATSSTLGGIKVGQYLSITDTGVLSVNKSSLSIPTIASASYDYPGILQLGSDYVLPLPFESQEENSYNPEHEYYQIPLQIDSNKRAGVNIDLTEVSNTIVPTIPTVNNSTITFTQGSTSQQITLNQSNSATISFTDTTYNVFGGCSANENGSDGLVPAPSEGDQNKFLNAKGNWETLSYPKDTNHLWQSNALSTHYFRIPKSWITSGGLADSASGYVPLFKILNVNNSDFRVSQYFEIISRLTYVYYGKYSLVYGNAQSDNQDLYSKNLLTISNISIDRKKDSGDPSLSLDIVAYYKQETIDGHQYGVITVYRKYNDIIVYSEDTFNVCILGQNNPNYSTPQNNYIYYCTNSFEDNETIITSSNVIYTNQPSTDLGTLITNVPIVNNP